MAVARNIVIPTFTPLARAWLVRVKSTDVYPAFGSRVDGSSTAITGAKHAEVPDAYTKDVSVPTFVRERCFDLYGYTRSLNWEWRRIGGCGKFSCIFTLDRFDDYWRINDLVDGSRGASKGYDVNSVIMKDDEARDITFRRMIQERWELEVEVSVELDHMVSDNEDHGLVEDVNRKRGLTRVF